MEFKTNYVINHCHAGFTRVADVDDYSAKYFACCCCCCFLLLFFFSRSETAFCLLSAALSYFNGAKATGGLPQISFDKDLRPFIFDIQITWKALRIYCLNCSCIYLFTRAFTLMFLYIFFTDMHHITEILSLI